MIIGRGEGNVLQEVKNKEFWWRWGGWWRCRNLTVMLKFSIHELKSQRKRDERHLHSLSSELESTIMHFKSSWYSKIAE